MSLPISKGQSQPSMVQLPAVARLAWIFASPDELLLLRLPLLAEIAQRRHKVLAIAPHLEATDIARLASLGIEAATIFQPSTRLNPIAGILARRRLSQKLFEWRASTVVVEDAEHIDAHISAAAQAGLSDIYAVLPALEGGPAPSGRQKSWRSSLGLASAVFAPTTNDCRLLDKFFERSLRVAVLPPVTLNLNEVSARPLPTIAGGLVVLGAAKQNDADPGAFVEACVAIANRCRLKAIDLDKYGMQSNGDTISSVDWIPVSGSLIDSVLPAVEMAHIIVVDKPSPAQMLVLAAALAVGRPVLVADNAQFRDFVDVGANGWLYAEGDAATLATSMATALTRPDLLAGMARTSRQKAERKLEQGAAWQSLFDIVGLADLRRRAA